MERSNAYRLDAVAIGYMEITSKVPAFVCILTVASLAMTGCGPASRESVAERNRRIVQHMNDEVWNKGNLRSIEEFYSRDFVRYFLPDGSESRGINALREHVREHREAFPDWREEIKHIVAEGDLVFIHFVSTGTNTGSWRDNAPTGKKIQINEMSILRIEDGKITEQWLLPDLFNLSVQLGLSMSPQGSGETSSPDQR